MCRGLEVEQVCEVADAACLSVKPTRAKHLLALVCTTTEQYSTVTVQYSDSDSNSAGRLV